MQVPALTNVTVVPETVQTGVVVDVNTTARPDEAVADTGNGALPIVLPGSAANVIVCAPLATVNDWVTCGAALKLPLPA